jgi:hypothetical protein
MTRTNNGRLVRRAGLVARNLRTRIREAASRNQFGPGRVDEADALWPSDFWHNHRGA